MKEDFIHGGSVQGKGRGRWHEAPPSRPGGPSTKESNPKTGHSHDRGDDKEERGRDTPPSREIELLKEKAKRRTSIEKKNDYSTKTFISFNRGSTWQPLSAPEVNSDGMPVNC